MLAKSFKKQYNKRCGEYLCFRNFAEIILMWLFTWLLLIIFLFGRMKAFWNNTRRMNNK